MPAAFVKAARVFAVLAAVGVSLLVLFLAFRPIATEDIWWHLKMGEVYFTQGLWPAVDPLLHTSRAAPIQHEWLFGVAVHLLDSGFGLYALRVVHALAVLVILGLVWAMARQASSSKVVQALVVIVFLALSQTRLIQLRPDLPTMVFAFSIAMLTWLNTSAMTVRRALVVCVLFLVWVNMHSLFAVALALLAAATVGAFVEDASPFSQTKHAKGLLLTMLAGGLVTLLNPRGIHQHLTFFHSSENSSIWLVSDEWTPFDPFNPAFNGKASLLSWGLTNLIIVAFAVVFAVSYARFKKSPSPQTLETLAPRHFLPAAAALATVFVSFRFQWLLLLPLTYIVRASCRFSFAKERFEPLGALVCVAILATFPSKSGWREFGGDTPSVASGYFTQAYNQSRYPDPGVFFLRDAGITGNLFNHYTLGGYFEYRLAPTLKAFIDGRTEHYTAQVKTDSHLIMNRSQAERLSLLDAYRVNVFFAYGGTYNHYRSRQDTLRLMNEAPGWVLVFRSLDHAIFLRQSIENAENLARVKSAYAKVGIDFDIDTGLRVDEVLAKNPQWAVSQQMVPPNFTVIQDKRLLLEIYRSLDDSVDAAKLR